MKLNFNFAKSSHATVQMKKLLGWTWHMPSMLNISKKKGKKERRQRELLSNDKTFH